MGGGGQEDKINPITAVLFRQGEKRREVRSLVNQKNSFIRGRQG